MTVFLISLFVASSLIFLDMFLVRAGIKNLRESPQTLHKQSVSRFGGIAIFLSLLIASNISDESEYEFLRNLLLCTSPVFLVGFIDDMKISIPPFVRLMLIIPSSLLCYYFLGTKAESLEIPVKRNNPFFPHKTFWLKKILSGRRLISALVSDLNESNRSSLSWEWIIWIEKTNTSK